MKFETEVAEVTKVWLLKFRGSRNRRNMYLQTQDASCEYHPLISLSQCLPMRIGSSRRSRLQPAGQRHSEVVKRSVSNQCPWGENEVTTQEVSELCLGGILRRRGVWVNRCDYKTLAKLKAEIPSNCKSRRSNGLCKIGT